MTDLAVIILQKNEALHIKRCLEKLSHLEPRQVFVVDCFSTDGSDTTAKEMEAAVVYHKWPGNQASQFNWALENLPIKASWILRLDADEYLYPETIDELMGLLPKFDGTNIIPSELPANITSFSIVRARRYLQHNIRFGGRDIELIRLFKFGCGRSEQSEMDEHIVTDSGVNLKLRGKFVDDSLISFEQWRVKHLDYAMREARMVASGAVNNNKRLYYKLPPFFRAVAFFCYRYFFRLGFLDGQAGWQWSFWQGLWYRWMVDRNICKLMRKLKTTGAI